LESLRSALTESAPPVCTFDPWPSPDPQNLDGIAHSAHCTQWSFSANDPFTTVALFSRTKALPKMMANAIEYEMHFYWQIYYYSTDMNPRYTGAFTSSSGQGFEVVISRRDLMRVSLLTFTQQGSTNVASMPIEDAVIPLVLAVTALISPLLSVSLLLSALICLWYSRSSLAVAIICIVYATLASLWYAVTSQHFRLSVSFEPVAIRFTVWVLTFGTISAAAIFAITSHLARYREHFRDSLF